MELESFLELEKRRLAEERQHLHGRSNVFDSGTPMANINDSMAQEIKNDHQVNEQDSLSKTTKDWINKQYNNRQTENGKSTSYVRKKKNKDDMEQWISDTFYSYFPGFNNEYQKRQIELQKRQRENQENLIKHQMLNNHNQSRKKYTMETSHINSARSNNSLTSNCANESMRGVGKTDMEIINVNNPNYIPSKHSSYELRPDSARYKLLQDLRHTNLTNLLNESSEDAIELNRRQAEIQSARKKKYQRELMQQIEDKRRTIKLLKDKEHEEDEVLTRRLQEQLNTMKLEEQLEKERIKAAKVRFNAEQNRISRQELLSKLEEDSKIIADTDLNTNIYKKLTTFNSETDKENIAEKNDNKVYKYFSNSEKYDYRYRNISSSLPTEIDLELDHTEMEKIERECFHLIEKICPICDEPLKQLENVCLRCQTKISFRIRSPLFEKNKTKKCIDKNDSDKNSVQHDTESERSFFLVCVRCERLYSWCKICTTKSDKCKACQNKRNLCMTCRKTLCSFCLEEVACGKDTESIHINDTSSYNSAFENKTTVTHESPKEVSFNYVDNNNEFVKTDNKSSNILSISAEYSSLNNLDYINNPPYSINIDQNSVFNPDNKPSPIYSRREEKSSIFHNNDFFNNANNDDRNIDKLRRDTDKRLFSYLKNYGDLVYQTRGTQTTPSTTGRRDIVIQGEHNLSIPLLSEMPKMTRMETMRLKENSKELKGLQRRWDVPAVQKYTISSLSPKIITQVGAVRKQLQIDNIFSDDTDSH